MRRFNGAGLLTRRAACTLLAAAGLAGLPASFAAAEDLGVSDWSVSDHARVRLIDAGPSTQDPPNSGRRLVGIEIELDPMYLTYWRSPGEAGVPPVVTFDGSVNLGKTTLLFPSPRRFSEDGTEAIGYKEGIVFPLWVAATDAAKPVNLALALSFAVCERQCLPVSATAKLALTGKGETPEAGLVRDALARIPTKQDVGQAGPLAITAVSGTAAQRILTVLAKTSGNDVPSLFAEAPDPWFVQADAGLWNNDGTIKYAVKVLARPEDPAPLPLRLTLVGVDGAIDVSVSLDAPPPKP